MRRGTAIASGTFAFLLGACGARTGLEVSDAPDANVAADAGDAAVFRSFPCRWFPEPPIELPLEPWSPVGAASQELVRVAFLGGDRDAVGGDVALTYLPFATPALDRSVPLSAVEAGESFVPRRGGWVSADMRRESDTCSIDWLTPGFELERSMRFESADGGCSLQAVDLDHAVLHLSTSAGGGTVSIVDLADGALRELSSAAPLGASGTRDDDGNEYLVVAVGGEWDARAHTPDGRILSVRWPLGSEASARLAPDRLIGGAVVLTEERGGHWVLSRLQVRADALSRETLAVLPRPPGFPLDLATNETEALLTLEDGSFVAIPLHSGEVRVFAAPPGAPRGVQLVLAPGASIGGQLWVEGDRVLFRMLTCNR